MKAKARGHTPGQMKKNEAAYQRHLEERQRSREIVRHRFEPMKFRLADLGFLHARFRGSATGARSSFTRSSRATARS